ncbi:MAG: phage/plasmid primase, P4 family [Thermodesulfobacteriota bacterium]
MTTAAADFFNSLYGCCEHNVNLRAIDPQRKRPAREAFVRGSGDIFDFAEKHASDHVYFGVATRNGTGTKDGIREIVAVHVDVDFKDTPREKASALLDAFPLPPTFVVETGGGWHLYWLLTAPEGRGAIPRVEAINRWLAQVLGGDLNACDASRILRVPGTRNHKYDSAPVVTISEAHPERRYALGDFDILAGDAPPPGPASEGIPEGMRNTTLTKRAGAMRRVGMSGTVIEAALLKDNAAHCQPPLPEAEVRGIAKSVARYEPAKAVSFPLSDAGNAELFAATYGEDLRHDHWRGRDLIFAGHHWREDPDDAWTRLAIESARRRFTAMAEADITTKARETVARWALRSEDRNRVAATLALARALPPIADQGDGWDAEPWLLGVPGGVVDLRTGEPRGGRREDKITKRAACDLIPGATCPRWHRFLDEIFEGNAELIDFVWRLIGYVLTGLTTEQIVVLLHGSGANGKSVFLNVLRHVLGEYGHNAPFSTFEHQHRAGVPTDVADLEGKRLITSAETGETTRLNEPRLKALSGGDPVTARRLFKDFYTFSPTGKIFLCVNHLPKVKDDSHGFWRRMRIIPFLRQFSPEEADRHLEGKLIAEAPGILAWAVAGCLEWQRRGLEPPACVLAATDAYREESDPVSEFLATGCLTGPEFRVQAGVLYDAYVSWAEGARLPRWDILSATAFGRRMSERFTKERGRGPAWYLGVGLPATETEVPF